jgi:hypothetical protein
VAKVQEYRDEAAALKAMRDRLERRTSNMEPDSSGLPRSWERARFENGSVDFPVDYATVGITDTQGLAHLKGSAALRERVGRAAEGPPGHRLIEVGRSWCLMSWFPSGRGDGRYGCYWGIAYNGEASSLIIDFDPPAR